MKKRSSSTSNITNRRELALSYRQQALELCQELGITLVKECEELLGQIQATLEGD
jgi:hypothetical protein